MTIHIYGKAPGMMASPARDTNTTLYRYELVGGALVRARLGDTQPCAEASRYLIDVLLNEDETGRYLNGVRGFIVPRRDQGRPDPAQDLRRRRTFEVGPDIMLAISRDLSVGPHLRATPRLAALDGCHVD